MKFSRRAFLRLAMAALLLFQGIAEAAEIRLFASGALKEAYLELIPAFEKASGHKVRLEWSSTTEIRKRVSAGEVHDLVILGDSGTVVLIGEGRLAGATRTVFAKSGISIAVRAGGAVPTRVTATLTDGRRISREVDHAPGFAERPMSRADLEAKFRGNVGKRWPKTRTDSALNALWALDQSKSLALLLGRFAD